jgi:DNA-binding winged helix-turn-helix (wHTH) protein
MASDTKVYRVVIASPGDVRAEREVVQRVIKQLNRELQDTQVARRLEVYRWEDVPPDSGEPQKIISKKIRIEECDIFIAILWRRFGLPPNIQGTDGNSVYRSGTQYEIDEALKARRSSKNERPRIMIYRMMDPVPPDMSDEEFEQFHRVRSYLKQFDPAGTTPALLSNFYSRGFAKTLARHLREVIAQFREAEEPIVVAARRTEGVRQVTISGDMTSSVAVVGDHNQITVVTQPDKADQPPAFESGTIDIPTVDARRIWLKTVGLRDDPFILNRADEESVLTRYFITPEGISIPDLIDIRRPNVVFGRPGSGKTTLRKIVSAACFPQRVDSGTLSLECGRNELESMLALVNGEVELLQPVHAAQALIQLLLAQIEALAAERKVNFSENARLQFAWLKATPSPLSLREWLKVAPGLLAAIDLKHVLFLIDQVDELAVIQQRPEAVGALLAPLFTLELREARGLSFNYFLPDSIALLLTGNAPRFRLDRCDVSDLHWSDAMLKRLVQQRLKAYAFNPLGGLSSLGQLCEGSGDFARTIENDLVTLAAGNPRAALWLAGQLIRVHCESAQPPRLIQPASWAQVQTRWFMTGRRRLFPVVAFWLHAGKVYYQEREVKLKAQSQRLLTCLIRAEGRVCEIAEVAQAGWPEAEAAGVSKRAIEEAMRRMKLELREQNIDPLLVQTVRGQGYRLVLTSANAAVTPEQG